MATNKTSREQDKFSVGFQSYTDISDISVFSEESLFWVVLTYIARKCTKPQTYTLRESHFEVSLEKSAPWVR